MAKCLYYWFTVLDEFRAEREMYRLCRSGIAMPQLLEFSYLDPGGERSRVFVDKLSNISARVFQEILHSQLTYLVDETDGE